MLLPVGAEGGDLSEWQDPAAVDYSSRAFWIIRASHGTTEDRHWREHLNRTVAAGRPFGLYHFFETQPPEAEARFFWGLVGFLTAAQVAIGWWLDSEWGRSAGDVDRFRIAVQLPTCGLYSNLAGFNGPLAVYKHFALNWLAMPTGTTLPPGWSIPDHILLQDGIVNGTDHNVLTAAQPLPAAWS